MSSPSRRPAARRTATGFLAALVALVVAASIAAPTSAVASGAHRSAGDDRDRARAVLAEARSLFDRKLRSDSGAARDATLVLRDLMLTKSALTGAERQEAEALLARPTDGAADPGGTGYQAGTTPLAACTSTACFHWVQTSSDAIDTTDSNGVDDGDGIPDYVEEVATAVTHVQSTYVGAGYRPVKPDGVLGGDARPDIYLVNIGPDGLYGYCTSDQAVPGAGPFDAWAYCVLDNDYAAGEFPTNTPLENMQVTAAHEYFHAVQFGYDIAEDAWFMEATATWAEDELYDDVDDNVQYLTEGPMGKPAVSLDTFRGLFQYGTWIFFRYLTERFTAAQGGMPTLVRDMWQQADGAAGGPDQYSMQAVASVLKARGTSLPAMFAKFADANLRSRKTYAEGAANSYPKTPLGKFSKAPKGWYATKLDHMSSASARVSPTKKSKTLKVILDMPAKKTGSVAVVTVNYKNGSSKTSMFKLSRKGNGAHKYPFARKSGAVGRGDARQRQQQVRRLLQGRRLLLPGVPEGRQPHQQGEAAVVRVTGRSLSGLSR